MKVCWGRLVGNRDGSVEVAGGTEKFVNGSEFYLLRKACHVLLGVTGYPSRDAHVDLTRIVVACHCRSICPVAFHSPFHCVFPIESLHCSTYQLFQCSDATVLLYGSLRLLENQDVILWGGDLDASRALRVEVKESHWLLMILSSWLIWYALLAS